MLKLKRELLASICAPHFTAGVVLWDDKIVESAPIVIVMNKGKWVVYEMDRRV